MAKSIGSEEFSDKMLDSMPMGAWVVDKDNNFTMFNKGMEKITGVAKEEAIGTNLMQYIPEKPMKDVAEFRELFSSVKDSLKSKRYHSLPITAPEDNLIYLSGTLIPYLMKTTTIVACLALSEMSPNKNVGRKYHPI